MQMYRHKPLVLTFDAFGTLFTPREPIGQQYVSPYSIIHPPSTSTRVVAIRPMFGKGLFLPPRCLLDISGWLDMCDEQVSTDSGG